MTLRFSVPKRSTNDVQVVHIDFLVYATSFPRIMDSSEPKTGPTSVAFDVNKVVPGRLIPREASKLNSLQCAYLST